MISILDYGSSNIRSVIKAFEHLGVDTTVVSDEQGVSKAGILVCPGQGAFNQSIEALQRKGLTDLLIQHIQKGRPFLGICLGFQLLFESSSENGEHNGLGVFKGHVSHFDSMLSDDLSRLKIPHMGWNTLDVIDKSDPYFKGVDQQYVYFVHSYAVFNSQQYGSGTVTAYGSQFLSAISKDNVLATQFHPEKSGEVGLSILKNFIDVHHKIIK